ncbi:Fe(3+)-citrate-binding protein YfmC [Halomicronema hongdechloris C2206]|uniref:Fe(3+)-citrate-binding protein YfmC n=1 Tax=Halomicronema hongdechloris C2206 TaxID=1641165 RepID=A0A1Z3HL19_9CYAN|nr:iron-siderophore ABC transporter substrate-binding protein [Halomicronema hongdechloris]ASC71019.1 Fe(3+)-citrate-binding protein YfmC [Halomicronema hongdechloris C2206]
MKQSKREIFQKICAISLLLLSSACNQRLSQNSASTTTQSTADCRVVEHDAGDTQVCGQPQRVATLSPYVLDMMLALGVQPVGHVEYYSSTRQQFDRPSEQIPYLGDRITTQPLNLGERQTPSLETLTLLKPDLILGERWHFQSYDLFSKVAPTVLVDYGEGGGWQEDIHPIAKALDRESEAEQVIAVHEQQVAAVQRKLASVLATNPRLLLITTVDNLSGSIHLFNKDTPGTLLERIGFELIGSEGVKRGTGKTISVEVLAQFSPDIVIVSGSQYGSHDPELNKFKQQWNQIPILQTMKANRNGCVYFVDNLLWGGNVRGPISEEIVMEQLPELLLPPCQNSKPEN